VCGEVCPLGPMGVRLCVYVCLRVCVCVCVRVLRACTCVCVCVEEAYLDTLSSILFATGGHQ